MLAVTIGHPPTGNLAALRVAERGATSSLTRISEPILRAHTVALRYGVHGRQWRISVEAQRDDADRGAMEAWMGRLRARNEETVGDEVEPGGRSKHAIDL